MTGDTQAQQTVTDAVDPTHYCVVCAARWVKWPDGNWSLVSKDCGPCCDNVAMDLAPIVAFQPDGSLASDDCERVKRDWESAGRQELVERYRGIVCAICDAPFETHHADWGCPHLVVRRFKFPAITAMKASSTTSVEANDKETNLTGCLDPESHQGRCGYSRACTTGVDEVEAVALINEIGALASVETKPMIYLGTQRRQEHYKLRLALASIRTLVPQVIEALSVRQSDVAELVAALEACEAYFEALEDVGNEKHPGMLKIIREGLSKSPINVNALNTLNVFTNGTWTVTSSMDAMIDATHDDYVVSLSVAEILAAALAKFRPASGEGNE